MKRAYAWWNPILDNAGHLLLKRDHHTLIQWMQRWAWNGRLTRDYRRLCMDAGVYKGTWFRTLDLLYSIGGIEKVKDARRINGEYSPAEYLFITPDPSKIKALVRDRYRPVPLGAQAHSKRVRTRTQNGGGYIRNKKETLRKSSSKDAPAPLQPMGDQAVAAALLKCFDQIKPADVELWSAKYPLKRIQDATDNALDILIDDPDSNSGGYIRKYLSEAWKSVRTRVKAARVKLAMEKHQREQAKKNAQEEETKRQTAQREADLQKRVDKVIEHMDAKYLQQIRQECAEEVVSIPLQHKKRMSLPRAELVKMIWFRAKIMQRISK